MSLVLNPLKAEDGIVNFVVSITFSRRFQSARYLLKVIPTAKRVYITKNNDELPHFNVKDNSFKNFFFPSNVIEWNKLDLNNGNSKGLTNFKCKVLKFIHPSENSIFLCNNPKGIQLLTRLRLGLSYLRDHKFKHNFREPLIQFVIAVRILKLRATNFFTVCSMLMKG